MSNATGTVTLTEFLLARIDEDEAGASDKHDQFDCDLNLLAFFGDCSCGYPARVLAECKRSRRIVELHAPTTEHIFRGHACETCLTDREGYSDDWGPDRWPCATVRALARVYADHPDYDPAWA